MDESRRKELELRLARLQDEKERRVSAPDEPSPVDAALEIEGDEDDWADDFGQGIAASLMKTGYGIADLVGGVGEGTFQLDPERLENLQADAKDSLGGTVGNVVGEVGQLAALAAGTIGSFGSATPVTAPAAVASVGRIGTLLKNAASGAKMAGRGLGKINPKTPVLREAALAGELGALQYADEGDSRLGNAAANAAMVGVGGAAIKGLSKAVKGANVTKRAKKMMDEGKVLTPGQAVEGDFWRGIENYMQSLPFLSKGASDAKARGVQNWGEYVSDKLGSQLGVRSKGFTPATNRLFKTKVRKGYEEAWGKAPGMSTKTIGQIRKIVEEAKLNKDPTGTRKLESILQAAEKLAKAPDGKGKQLLDGLIKNGKTQDDVSGLNSVFDELQGALRNNINVEARTALNRMDKLYPQFKAFERAMENRVDDVVTPETLRKAGKFIGRKGSKYANARSPFYYEAKTGAETVGRKEPKILLDILKGAVQRIPTYQPIMDAGGRAVLGQTKVQQIAQPAIRRMEALSKALRKKRGTGIGSVFAGMEQ